MSTKKTDPTGKNAYEQSDRSIALTNVPCMAKETRQRADRVEQTTIK
jgi:hypothetical protein